MVRIKWETGNEKTLFSMENIFSGIWEFTRDLQFRTYEKCSPALHFWWTSYKGSTKAYFIRIQGSAVRLSPSSKSMPLPSLAEVNPVTPSVIQQQGTTPFPSLPPSLPPSSADKWSSHLSLSHLFGVPACWPPPISPSLSFLGRDDSLILNPGTFP